MANRLITERELQAVVQRLAESSETLDIAVSYCGLRAADFLPEKSRPSQIRVVVDMSRPTVQRGFTNPRGIAKLCQIADVRSLEGLHSKVIIGTKSAVIGSANFSRTSVERQRQCCILATDKSTIYQASRWFRDLWRDAIKVNEADCRRSEVFYPDSNYNGESVESGRTNTGARLRQWKSPLNDYALTPGDFRIGLTKDKMRRAIKLFRTTQCGYRKERVTCAEQFRKDVGRFNGLSRQFRSLIRRIDRWNRDDVTQLFELAMNGRAAMIYKPTFLRNRQDVIKRTMRHLFVERNGDPLIRFEQAVTGKYKLSGLSKSGLAFLMFLWRPDEYPIWNNSVDRGLERLKVTVHRTFGNNIAQGYADRIAALRAMMKKTGLKTFHEIDHFIDAFAKEHLSL